MYRLKQVPEDFIVREISSISAGDTGNYEYFLLKKTNYNTLKAIEKIAEKLKISPKNIGFAGNKDRNAVTEQIISIKSCPYKKIESLAIKGIELRHLGRGNQEIYIGGLKGNEFLITIRGLSEKDTGVIKEKIKSGQILMPNPFGEQRFSGNNAAIGKAIIKGDFKQAIDLVLNSNSEFNQKIILHLEKRKNDFVGALKIMPFKLLKLYVHSYQSFLFNKTLEIYILAGGYASPLNAKLPIIGFSAEAKHKKIRKIIESLMQEEKITERDFIIRAIPDLSPEGSERNAFIKINDFKIIKAGKDELNDGKKKMVVSFSLPKGCYATVLIDFLFKS